MLDGLCRAIPHCFSNPLRLTTPPDEWEMLVSDVQRIYKFGKDAQGVNVTEGSAKDNYILGGI